MAGYDEYLQKKADKKLCVINTQKEEKKVQEKQDEYMPATLKQFKDMYDPKLDEKISFEDRTKSYFDKADMMPDKEEKLGSIKEDSEDIYKNPEAFKNHEAEKKHGYDKEADRSFKQAEAFESDHKNNLKKTGRAEKKDFSLYQHREKVMRQRMDGLVRLAHIKTKSPTDEKYKTLKAEYSCLRILKGQLNALSQFATDEKEIKKFDDARQKLEKELEEVEEKLKAVIPFAYRLWLENHGLIYRPPEEIPDPEKLYDAINRDNEMPQEELSEITKGAKKEKIFGEDAPYDDPEEMKEIISHPCFAVKKDAQGNPVDKTEMQKLLWNEKWFEAIKNGDEKLKNDMLKEAYDRFLKFDFPTEEEIKEKGLKHFFSQDPSGYFEVIRLANSYDKVAKVDKFSKDYVSGNPELLNTIEMVRSWPPLDSE